VTGPDELTAALQAGYQRAAGALDSGAALALLDQWARVSQRLAAEPS
jgi:anthranilate phosphoribosyltransferase